MSAGVERDTTVLASGGGQWSIWAGTWHVVVLLIVASIVATVAAYVAILAAPGKIRAGVAAGALAALVAMSYPIGHHWSAYAVTAVMVPVVVIAIAVAMLAAESLGHPLASWATGSHRNSIPWPMSIPLIIACLVVVPALVSAVDFVFPPSELVTRVLG